MSTASEVLKLQEGIWGLTNTKLVSGIHCMYRRAELHSFAVVAYNPGWKDPSYAIPMVQFAMMRMFGDRFHKPTSAYIEGEGGVVHCANWPVQSGMLYTVAEDEKLGGLVCVPHAEFKLVEKRTT